VATDGYARLATSVLSEYSGTFAGTADPQTRPGASDNPSLSIRFHPSVRPPPGHSPAPPPAADKPPPHLPHLPFCGIDYQQQTVRLITERPAVQTVPTEHEPC
jgi:hypothetical protein